MELFARRRRRRTTILAATTVIAVAAAILLVKPWQTSWWPLGDDEVVSPVPTVPIAGTAVDFGCVDEAGEVTAAAGEWYPADATGAVTFEVEIAMSSLQLSRLAEVMFDQVADEFGGYATTAIRDLVPTPGFCTTHHFVEVVLNDGAGEIVAIAWRSVAGAPTRTLPNEGEFVVLDDSSFASVGPHLVSVLKVAPDGTSVLISAYGTNAYGVLNSRSELVPVTATDGDLGAAPATVEQLRPLADAALAAMLARPGAG